METSLKAAKPVLKQSICMSTLGVVLTSILTGVFCHYVLHMSLKEGMLLGAVVGSTDAASVFSILRSKQLNLKDGTASILEVESGSNDPVAYMMTMIILSWMSLSNQNIVWMLIKQIGVGFLFGIGVGVLAVWSLKHIEFEIEGMDTILMIALVLFAYAGSVLLGGNGYLSVYLQGIIIGNQKFDHKVVLIHFFDGINHLAQILIFFLLGLLVFPSQLLGIAGSAILVFIGLTFIARPIATFLLLLPFRASFKQKTLIAFSGLRGAASIVFAIMVTVSPVYTKSDVFNIVFCVALISVTFQGLLLPVVAERLDMLLMEETVEEGDGRIGCQIKDLPKMEERMIALIRREDGSTVIPKGETVIQKGDVLAISGN